jgi:phosphoglycerol transferase MdoB-like AlkP superfamily enzyme
MKNSTALVKEGLYRCTGINEEVMEDYLTISNLVDMTTISDDNSDNFLMLDNELTHWPIYYKEPEYEVAYFVDNEQYEKEHADRYTLDGVTLEMENDVQIGSYQVNMCALLKIGAWLEYLKEQGVYDNTRIIIVSDHGKWVYHNDMFDLDGSGDYETDIESYYPLLMIKDFDSHGFTVDEQFMTNADVPTYALDGILENPVNPFTGKAITNDAKEGPQKILGSHYPDVITNNGTVFIDGIWYSVEDDMRDKNNWKLLEDNR